MSQLRRTRRPALLLDARGFSVSARSGKWRCYAGHERAAPPVHLAACMHTPPPEPKASPGNWGDPSGDAIVAPPGVSRAAARGRAAPPPSIETAPAERAARADVSFTLARATLDSILVKQKTFPDAVKAARSPTRTIPAVSVSSSAYSTSSPSSFPSFVEREILYFGNKSSERSSLLGSGANWSRLAPQGDVTWLKKPLRIVDRD
jgi:hypothetical protein